MKNIARRIINAFLPTRKNYTAMIAYSGLICHVRIEAPDERRARIELNEIADDGFVIDFYEGKRLKSI